MITQRLKEIRKSCALTQTQVADLLNIERSTYTCYEIGKANPPLSTMLKLSKIFNVSIDYLVNDQFTGKNSRPAILLNDTYTDYHSGSSFLNLRDDEKKLLMHFRLMNEKDKLSLLDNAEKCVKSYD